MDVRQMADSLFGGVQAIKETIQAIAPGLDGGKMKGEIGGELQQMGAHGAHELAAALFNGNSFVMYPRGVKEDHGMEQPDHGVDNKGLEQEAQKQQMGSMSM